MVAALRGIQLDDIRHFSLLASDLHQPRYDFSYIFIEPSYDVLHDYRAGTSQHPLADVTHGDGGFFDHASPPPARSPGDTVANSEYNHYGFTFERYGPRVPAVVISPLIPKNLIDHRFYDHASIPATLESLFGLSPLTARDAGATRLDALISLSVARGDAPVALPAPAVDATPAARPDDTVNDGNVPGILHAAMRQDLALAPDQRRDIIARVSAIKTRSEAMQYLAEVQHKVQQHRGTICEK